MLNILCTAYVVFLIFYCVKIKFDYNDIIKMYISMKMAAERMPVCASLFELLF